MQGRKYLLRLSHILLLGLFLPAAVSIVVYYGFGVNYTKNVFHEAGFRDQYESGIYRYRVLGPKLLLCTYSLLQSDSPAVRRLHRLLPLPESATAFDNEADRVFYFSYFIQNTICMMGASVVLYLLLTWGSPNPYAARQTVLAVVLMGLTQFVICPYDTMSYALLLLSFFLIMHPSRFGFRLLVLVLILSTLTRESAALTIAFYCARHYLKIIGLHRTEVARLCILVTAFAAVYSGLRLYYGSEHAMWQSIQFGENFRSPFALVGVATFAALSCMLAIGSSNKKAIIVFLAASSPYIVATLIVAYAWELRLWMPVWLGVMCLADQPQEPTVPANAALSSL